MWVTAGGGSPAGSMADGVVGVLPRVWEHSLALCPAGAAMGRGRHGRRPSATSLLLVDGFLDGNRRGPGLVGD